MSLLSAAHGYTAGVNAGVFRNGFNAKRGHRSERREDLRVSQGAERGFRPQAAESD